MFRQDAKESSFRELRQQGLFRCWRCVVWLGQNLASSATRTTEATGQVLFAVRLAPVKRENARHIAVLSWLRERGEQSPLFFFNLPFWNA
jgi:hypothetical protein